MTTSTDNTGWMAEEPTTQAPNTGSLNQMIDARKKHAAEGPTQSFSAQQAPSLMSLLSGLDTQNSLSEEGLMYFNKLRSTLEDKSWGSANNISIKTITLNDPVNSWAFVNENTHSAMIVLFVEDYSSETSDVDYRMTMFRRARNVMKGIDPMIDILNTLVIYREDYASINKMIIDIKNSFRCEVVPSAITMHTLAKSKYVIDTSIEAVRAEATRMSPHGILPWFQYGFTIGISQPKTDGMSFLNNNQRKEYETKIIAVVTARTRIVGPAHTSRLNSGYGSGPTRQFQPIAEITGIFSPLKNIELLALVLPIAQQLLIIQGGWKDPYFNFGSPTYLDIGKLFQADNGTLMSATSRGDVEDIIQATFNNPYLSINIPEGRSRLRGIEWLASPDTMPGIVNMLNNCYSTLHHGDVMPQEDMAARRIPEFIGTVIDNGVVTDSRCIEFLSIVAKSETDYSPALPFRGFSSDPNALIPLLKNISGNYTPRYLSNNVVLSYNSLNLMCSVLNNNITLMNSNTNNNNNMTEVFGQLNMQAPQSVTFNNGGYGNNNANQTYGQFMGFSN